MRHQNRHLRRRDLPLILAITVVAVASRCVGDDYPTQPPSAAHDQFPQVFDLTSRTGLPDPLVMLDGRRVTTRDQWVNQRRPELIQLFQHYMYGFLPPQPKTISGKGEREDRNAFDGRATLREVTVTFGPPELPPIDLMLVIPNHRQVPAPVVLGMNYFGNHTLVRDPAVRLSTNWMPERGEGVVNNRATEASRGTWVDIWRIEYLIERGYAVATFYNGDIDPDRPDQRGLQEHFRKLDPHHDCGTIAAWAWGLQRAIDYLVTVPDLDQHRIVVTGHSRLGKAALLAAAFDERIALTIPHQAGCGGSAPSRTAVKPAEVAGSAPRRATGKPPETVRQLNDKFPHGFNARFKEFDDRPDRLPFDQHCLVALCAPRPVLFTNGREDTWINPAGQFEVLRGAAAVYRLLGAGDFSATKLPPDGTLIDGTLGYFLRPGGHSLKPEDWKAFLDFADKQLGPPAKPRSAAAPRTIESVAVELVQSSPHTPCAEIGTRSVPSTILAMHLNEDTAASVEMGRWELHEFELQGRCRVENPFRDVALVGKFTAPSGKTTSVEGFYDGDDTWRLRFAPDEEGEWRYRLRGEGAEILQGGSLHCVAQQGHGFIGLHPQNPYAFAYADGRAFFPMGDTCYGLYDDSHITPARRSEYLETRRGQRFNFVRMSVGHSEARAAADPAFWAWGGTPTHPDLDRLNPVFFRGLDELFRDLRARGMNVELLLLNFYRRPFTDPKLWTPARERLWLRYVVARYAAFDNLFLWTLANEYETHPDGRYRLDQPGDAAWAKATAQLVKQFDPYRHPVTVHPVVSSSTRGASPRDPFDAPWRIGEFFGAGDELDVLSQQTGQVGAGVAWDDKLQCWVGDAPDVVASLHADRRFRKPVLNTESGYEYLRGHPTEKKQVHHTDKVRRTSWRIVCAGGYFAAGFHGTIGHSDIWNRIDAPNRYTFTVQDEGAGRQLGTLYDFFTAFPFWRLQPFDGVTGAAAVALAEPGRAYVVYLPQGGHVTVDLSAAQRPLTAAWFNPRDGQAGAPFPASAGQPGRFQSPDAQDWVLHLCVEDGRLSENPARTETLVPMTEDAGAKICVFPGKDWANASPESQGVDAAKLKAAVETLDRGLKEYGAAGTVFIVRNGYVIWAGPECDRQYQIFSATKSFTSTVLGLLIDDGKVTLNTLAKDLDPALAEHYPTVALRHFATMTSGYDSLGGNYEFDDQDRGDSWNPGPPAPPLFPPGSKFRYWDDAMSQFGGLLTRAAGESLDRLFQRRIADPLGMTKWRWTENDSPVGRVLSWSGGIHTSSRELARFGHLFLNRGNWNGRQLVSASWVEQATSVQVPASVPNDDLPRSRGAGVYGYNWWVNGVKPNGQRLWPGAPPRTFYANGLHSNVCIVVPEWNLVVARTNRGRKAGGANTPPSVDEIWSAFFARLAEAFGLQAEQERDRKKQK